MWLAFGIEPVQLLTAFRYTIFLPFDALIALKVGIFEITLILSTEKKRFDLY